MLLHMRSTVDFCQSMQYFVSSNCLPQCDATTFYDVPAYVSLLNLIAGVVVTHSSSEAAPTQRWNNKAVTQVTHQEIVHV